MASLLLGSLPIPSQYSLPLASRFSFSHSQTLSTSLPSFSASSSISSLSAASSPPPFPSVYCGRGDKKTERGKRFNHSYGNARPRDKKKGRGPPRAPAPPSPPRKDKFDSNEKITIEIDESLFSN
ncbi:hypothetical protein TIFTF001_028711 [Ficus carica]|uniref:30S ribosomal protein S31, chloroplastic n=1 Tax=Ficus carica TaxID=3494 RepID=A0AA88J1W7_FICCA|nr:hypothetical protein TIFTF001_028711 [Ficus carica]